MSVKLLTEHRLEFVSLKGGCTGSSESTLVKMHCVAARIDAYDTLGTFIAQRKRPDKYHKSSFSCMQCAVSCSSSLILFFYFMQTHEKKTQLGNYVFCAKSASPRATRVLKQQDKFDEFISPDEGLFERNM